MKDLPLESLNQSYLKKAGVNFNLNVVDTVLKKGFTLSFYLSLVLLVLLLVLKFSGTAIGVTENYSDVVDLTTNPNTTSILNHFLNPKQFWCMVSLLSI
ncbi:MAG: hypothetical protein MR287_07690, partial [Succinivibrio sp.]|nr:hypothetical protein [Succinivibrio sp.]